MKIGSAAGRVRNDMTKDTPRNGLRANGTVTAAPRTARVTVVGVASADSNIAADAWSPSPSPQLRARRYPRVRGARPVPDLARRLPTPRRRASGVNESENAISSRKFWKR